MTKTMTLKEIRDIGFVLFSNWDAEKANIKLSGKNLYNLIALKHKFGDEMTKIQEGLNIISEQNGAVLNEQKGQYEIPPDKLETTIKKMDEILAEQRDFIYEPIVMTNDCSLPVGLLDLLFGFIEFQD